MANCTVLPSEGCAPDTGVRNIYNDIFNNGKNNNAAKPICVAALAEWYSDRQNIIAVWNDVDGLTGFHGLNNIEKEFISVYVQYEGEEFVPTTKAIAEKHGITPPEERYSYYSSRYDFYDTSGYSAKYLRFLHLIKNYDIILSKRRFLCPYTTVYTLLRIN